MIPIDSVLFMFPKGAAYDNLEVKRKRPKSREETPRDLGSGPTLINPT